MSAELLNVREELRRLERPSDRDLEIFERVAGGKVSQLQAAREFGLTQGRVSQIVAGVRAWLIAATEEEAGDLPPDVARRYAGRLVRIRMESLLGMCMDAFRESKQDTRRRMERDSGDGPVRTDVRESSCGDPRWLTHYRHIALALARLDGVPSAPKIERPAEVDAQAAARVAAGVLAQAAEPGQRTGPGSDAPWQRPAPADGRGIRLIQCAAGQNRTNAGLGRGTGRK